MATNHSLFLLSLSHRVINNTLDTSRHILYLLKGNNGRTFMNKPSPNATENKHVLFSSCMCVCVCDCVSACRYQTIQIYPTCSVLCHPRIRQNSSTCSALPAFLAVFRPTYRSGVFVFFPFRSSYQNITFLFWSLVAPKYTCYNS